MDNTTEKFLHSHSALERFLRLPKHLVLVDECYGDLFNKDIIIPFKYKQVRYYKVPILSFLRQGGVFKNLDK